LISQKPMLMLKFGKINCGLTRNNKIHYTIYIIHFRKKVNSLACFQVKLK